MRSEPEPTNYFLTFMEEPRKKRFKMYSILIIPLVLFMYLMGYLFAYPNLAKALVKDKISFFNTKQQSEIPMFVWYSQNYQVKMRFIKMEKLRKNLKIRFYI